MVTERVPRIQPFFENGELARVPGLISETVNTFYMIVRERGENLSGDSVSIDSRKGIAMSGEVIDRNCDFNPSQGGRRRRRGLCKARTAQNEHCQCQADLQACRAGVSPRYLANWRSSAGHGNPKIQGHAGEAKLARERHRGSDRRQQTKLYAHPSRPRNARRSWLEHRPSRTAGE